MVLLLILELQFTTCHGLKLTAFAACLHALNLCIAILLHTCTQSLYLYCILLMHMYMHSICLMHFLCIHALNLCTAFSMHTCTQSLYCILNACMHSILDSGCMHALDLRFWIHACTRFWILDACMHSILDSGCMNALKSWILDACIHSILDFGCMHALDLGFWMHACTQSWILARCTCTQIFVRFNI